MPSKQISCPSGDRRSLESSSNSLASLYSKSAPWKEKETEFALPVSCASESETSVTHAQETKIRSSAVTKVHRISALLSFQLFSNRIASLHDDCIVSSFAEDLGIERALKISRCFNFALTENFRSTPQLILRGEELAINFSGHDSSSIFQREESHFMRSPSESRVIPKHDLRALLPSGLPESPVLRSLFTPAQRNAGLRPAPAGVHRKGCRKPAKRAKGLSPRRKKL